MSRKRLETLRDLAKAMGMKATIVDTKMNSYVDVGGYPFNPSTNISQSFKVLEWLSTKAKCSVSHKGVGIAFVTNDGVNHNFMLRQHGTLEKNIEEAGIKYIEEYYD